MSKTGCQALVLFVTNACFSALPVCACARTATTTGEATSAASDAATLPPDLVSLEQKMQELDVNTERVSRRFTFPGVAEAVNQMRSTGTGRSHRKLRPSKARRSKGKRRSRGVAATRERALVSAARKAVPSMTATGEVSLEPQEGIFDFVGPHGERMEERQIGEDIYVRAPGLAKLAGGRRWEMQSAAGLKQAGLGFGLPGEPAGKGMFAGLIEELENASSVVEVGEVTVDGEQTTEFVARLDASTVMNPLSRSEGKVEMRVRKAFEKLGLELKVFIEPDGLPVRTKLVFGVKKRFETAEANILAVGVPVEVLAPPAAEVITEAELKKRIEVDARRRCPHLQPVGCRLRSQPPS